MASNKKEGKKKKKGSRTNLLQAAKSFRAFGLFWSQYNVYEENGTETFPRRAGKPKKALFSNEDVFRSFSFLRNLCWKNFLLSRLNDLPFCFVFYSCIPPQEIKWHFSIH